MAAPKVDVAAFIEATWLRPHRSAISGQMVLDLEAKYRIPPLWTLVVLGAESSLGDPRAGGELARHNNFGCVKAAVRGPWEATTDGTITVRGVAWWTWPTAEAGMDAWGLYFSTRFEGLYPSLLKDGLWREFAATYYGSDVAGFEIYAADLLARVAAITEQATEAGLDWA